MTLEVRVTIDNGRGRQRLRFASLVATIAAGLVLIPVLPAVADWTRDREYWLTDYGFTSAWASTTGDGVLVSVIDSGIADVPELAGAVVGGADFSGQGSADGRTPVGPSPNHGTLVASVLAARGEGDGDGMIGTAPGAQLLSASISIDPDAPVPFDDQIPQAVRWSVDQGATVINMSITRGSLSWPESWDDAFLYAAEHNVVIVAASGNRAQGTDEVGAPATIPGVLTVAGVDRQGEASQQASTQGITIGVAAPAEELIGVNARGSVVSWAGSSGASPIVAGLVALVRAAHPELDAANVINRVTSTATATGDPAIYGHGLINADAAVNADVAPVVKNPLGDLAEWITMYRRAPSTSTPMTTMTSTPLPLPTSGRPFASVSQYELTQAVVPSMFLLGFGILITLGSITVARRLFPRRTPPADDELPPSN
ncbi:MAG: S8 family peptidase [Microbacteriaceae bacterium]